MTEGDRVLFTNIPLQNSDGDLKEDLVLPHHTDFPIKVSAPGKVILYGEHSVVYGKLAIAASLGLRTKLTLAELDEESCNDFIKIELPAISLLHCYHLKDIQDYLLNKPIPSSKSPSFYNWENPHLINHAELLHSVEVFIDSTAGSVSLNSHQKQSLCAIFYLFTAILGSTNVDLKPFAIKVETDLVINSGSGSSASYSVTLVAAFIQYIRVKAAKPRANNISKYEYKPSKIWNTSLGQFDDKELDLISKWAYMTEKIMHGSPSGIDNAICTYGSFVEFSKGGGLKLAQLCELSLLLVNTKVKRDTKCLMKNVADLKERHPQVVGQILNAMDEISRSALKSLKQLNDLLTMEKFDEKEIIDLHNTLAELAEMNHHLLQALGVSHVTLDKICNILKTFGLSGKLTGAGGGGYAVAIIPFYIKDDDVHRLIEELRSNCFEATITKLGGPGVAIDD